jgi:hypothetical protein
MIDEIKLHRKTNKLVEGKTSILSLKSKFLRNNLAVRQIEEFVMCIAAARLGYLIPQLQQKEFSIMENLSLIHQENEAVREAHLKNLSREIAAIKTEARDTSVLKRVSKANEFLQLLNRCILS